jgi:outer membrane protein assembly factor BamB
MKIATSLLATLTLSAFAADPNSNWPQWRGPLQTGVAPKANPPTKWSETQNVKWKVELPGEGHATPIIWENQIFIQAAVPVAPKAQALSRPNSIPTAQAAPPPGEGPGRRGGGGRGGFGGAPPKDVMQFTLLSYDRNTGKQNWKKIAKEALPHEGRHGTGTYASPSPVTDGQNVFAFFGSQGMYCYDMAGNLKWTQDLGDMRIKNTFGEGSSPALHRDTLVVLWDHEGEDFIVALDKKNGKELWRQPREEGTSWSTPLIVEHDGKAQVITSATGKVRSYDLATGKQIWEHAGLTQNTIPSPVHADGIVYAMAGHRGNALYAIKLGKTGDLTDTDAVLWKHAKSTPYVPSPLLVGNRLYFTAHNNAILSAFAKNGQPLLSEERLEGLQGIYASPIAANGHVYISSQNGATVVLKDADKLEVLSLNQLDDRFDASPAAVGNQLFLRGKKNLYCLAEK